MCACRDGSAACQKRREWGLIAGGDSGAFRLSRIQQTSLTWGFAETPLAIRIIVLALGPWTPPFRAPLWHFLPSAFAGVSGEDFC